MWTACLDQLAGAWISLVLLTPRVKVNINKRIGDAHWSLSLSLFFSALVALVQSKKRMRSQGPIARPMINWWQTFTRAMLIKEAQINSVWPTLQKVRATKRAGWREEEQPHHDAIAMLGEFLNLKWFSFTTQQVPRLPSLTGGWRVCKKC